MGLLLSILVGCVGVLELLSSFKQVTNEVSITSTGPTTPCLSYHGPSDDVPSFHDSICSISHSGDIPITGSAKRKLENLHEYSLRVRSELKSVGGSDWSTLSDCSTRDLLSPSRTDSRLSLMNFDPSIGDQDEDDAWRSLVSVSPVHQNTTIFIVDEPANVLNERITIEEINEPEVEGLTNKGLVAGKAVNEYVRVPTPIPLGISQEISRSNSSLSSSLDIESGNEVPTRISFDQVPVILARYDDDKSSSTPESSIDEEDDISSRVRKRGFIRISRSRSPDVTKIRSTSHDDHVVIKSSPKILINEGKLAKDITKASGEALCPGFEITQSLNEIDGASAKNSEYGQRRGRTDKIKTTSTVLRKPTRLKSKNAEISKSAENLVASNVKRTKRQREPERRKSDISVQTMKSEESLRDEWTNTSPTNSEVSIGAIRTSVSVEVQTSFDEKSINDLSSFEIPVIGLSESRRDIGIKDRDNFGRKAFRNRRFPTSIATKSRSLDDYTNLAWIPGDVDEFVALKDTTRVDGERLEKKERKFEDNARDSSGRSTTTRERRFELLETSRSVEEDSSVDEEFVDAEELIFSGEYTKAMNKDWHSGHFCCWQCDESLTGQRYVLRDEHPYCIKCYESVFANGCEECSKIIGIDSKDLSYKDKHWHEACFLCNKCRVSLVDKQFGSKVDKIYCGNCYDAQFASRCDGCGEIFRAGTKKMEYKTRQWHEKCFCCVVCKNPIGTKSFIPREQEIYCAGCYEDKFATRCVKCNKIITSGGVTYKNEPWHRDCFTCSNCDNSLAGQRFTSRDDKPYCAECFGELFAKRCTACTKPITGIGGTRFISFEDRHWHNNCFICAGCNTSLVGRGFITDGDDIICPECAKQKLSE